MTQESRTQETAMAQTGTPALALESGELTVTTLVRVVGGTDGPGNLGDDGTDEPAVGGRRVVIIVPS